jgi:hypothetical protein
LAQARLAELAQQKAKRNALYDSFRLKYWDNPAGFVLDCFTWPAGAGPSPYQLEFLSSLTTHKRIAAYGPHGLGKSAMLSWLTWWFSLTRDGTDWKIPTTASAWRQLEEYLWPEVHKWAGRLRWDVIGRPAVREKRELLDLSLKLDTGHAFAVASDKPELIEGAHADHILYIFDEAKVIPDETWDSAEGAFSTGDARAVAVSTPGDAVGRFYEIATKKGGYADWHVRPVTVDECIDAGRISRDWVEARRAQWKDSNPIFINRVLGRFVLSNNEAGIIPAAWVLAAQERWKQQTAAGLIPPVTGYGVDVARFGDDSSVIAPRHGTYIAELVKFERIDTMRLAAEVAARLNKTRGWARIDVVGVGAGVYDRLKGLGYNVVAHNGAEGTDEADSSGLLEFVNMRAWAWWNAREMLSPDSGARVALPPDEELLVELTAPAMIQTNTGRVGVELKEKVKSRIGRSPDKADAVVMALLNHRPPRKPVAGETYRLPIG